MYDYVIVGAGPYGCTFARKASDAGRSVLLVDRRGVVGGNCATSVVDGVQVHEYGPHLFHTNSEEVWGFVNEFGEFNGYQARILADAGSGPLYSFPLNLWTFQQLWGVRTGDGARERIARTVDRSGDQGTIEGWCLANIGRELYELFIEGYTRKQWRRDPATLPAAIVRRLAVRYTFDDRYFGDRYQGIPLLGYTRLFERMVDARGVDRLMDVDFHEDRRILERLGGKLVYTGKVDAYFDYRHGDLEYRTLRFAHARHDGDFQGAAIVNHTSSAVPWTRRVEHKHFLGIDTPRTVVTTEYPEVYTRESEPYYPILDSENRERYERYREAAKGLPRVIFGGRLGTYQYLDMHQVIAQAMAAARRELTGEA
jgi:UDP-galactopyranose mutase